MSEDVGIYSGPTKEAKLEIEINDMFFDIFTKLNTEQPAGTIAEKFKAIETQYVKAVKSSINSANTQIVRLDLECSKPEPNRGEIALIRKEIYLQSVITAIEALKLALLTRTDYLESAI